MVTRGLFRDEIILIRNSHKGLSDQFGRKKGESGQDDCFLVTMIMSLTD